MNEISIWRALRYTFLTDPIRQIVIPLTSENAASFDRQS